MGYEPGYLLMPNVAFEVTSWKSRWKLTWVWGLSASSLCICPPTVCAPPATPHTHSKLIGFPLHVHEDDNGAGQVTYIISSASGHTHRALQERRWTGPPQSHCRWGLLEYPRMHCLPAGASVLSFDLQLHWPINSQKLFSFTTLEETVFLF